MKILTSLLLSIVILSACSTEPRDIQYGQDNCHYCKMTVVDQQHAAELVSDKGKVFVYDAIECMLYDLKDHPNNTYSHFVVNVYEQPKTLANAVTSSYLISKNLPSPMGANLTAFDSKETIQNIKREKGGQIYSWEELKTHFDL